MHDIITVKWKIKKIEKIIINCINEWIELIWMKLNRFERHHGLQVEIDPGSNMDADFALFHLDAHVGWWWQ